MRREKNNPRIKSHSGGKIASPKEIAAAIDKMDNSLFYINTLLNSAKFIKAFINNNCLCYAVFNESMVRALKLPRVGSPPANVGLHLPNGAGRYCLVQT
jgi:hypothetical protein